MRRKSMINLIFFQQQCVYMGLNLTGLLELSINGREQPWLVFFHRWDLPLTLPHFELGREETAC